MDRFYVYTLAYPDGTPFYVGKGCGKRVADHEKEARKGCDCFKCLTIRKIWSTGGEVQRNIVFRTNNEQQAYDHERALIAEIGYTKLTNISPGGGRAAPWNFLPDKSIDQMDEEEYTEYLQRMRRLTDADRTERLRLWRSRQYHRLTKEIRWLKLQRKHERVAIIQAEIDRLRPLVIEPFDYFSETG